MWLNRNCTSLSAIKLKTSSKPFFLFFFLQTDIHATRFARLYKDNHENTRIKRAIKQLQQRHRCPTIKIKHNVKSIEEALKGVDRHHSGVREKEVLPVTVGSKQCTSNEAMLEVSLTSLGELWC